MTQAIWKFVLPSPDSTLAMPRWAHVLSVGHQPTGICIWAIVDPKQEVETRRFRVFPTGMPLDEETFNHGPAPFIGTVQVGDLVWHIFEVSP